mmetsp:Transcript_27994/g.77020  ORF Transcript_27994/g.77020 Transcript_27994/m.77020 type:complete len:286 (+) Transcript_27994:102-959(+)
MRKFVFGKKGSQFMGGEDTEDAAKMDDCITVLPARNAMVVETNSMVGSRKRRERLASSANKPRPLATNLVMPKKTRRALAVVREEEVKKRPSSHSTPAALTPTNIPVKKEEEEDSLDEDEPSSILEMPEEEEEISEDDDEPSILELPQKTFIKSKNIKKSLEMEDEEDEDSTGHPVLDDATALVSAASVVLEDAIDDAYLTMNEFTGHRGSSSSNRSLDAGSNCTYLDLCFFAEALTEFILPPEDELLEDQKQQRQVVAAKKRANKRRKVRFEAMPALPASAAAF